MMSTKFIISIAILAIVLTFVAGQLTFSPGWGNGKRSISLYDQGHESDVRCKFAKEILLDIFKFIQNQGQMFAECNPKTN